jgi:hypothetical protein
MQQLQQKIKLLQIDMLILELIIAMERVNLELEDLSLKKEQNLQIELQLPWT